MVIINTRVFISYASQEKDIAYSICDSLEKNGKDCWIAPRNIPVGTEYGEEIIKGIENSNIMVLVFSEASNKSQHVLREVERAVNKKIPIIAFKIEECVLSKSLEYFLLSNQWLDAVTDRPAALEALNVSIDGLTNLSAITPGSATPPSSTIRVTNKAVPILLGFIAVAIAAVAIVIAIPSDNGKDVNVPVTVTDANGTTTAAGGEEPVNTPDETTGEVAAPEFNEGEYVQFGRYFAPGYSEENNDAELVWQIIGIDETNGTIKLVSANIIDIKPYDCADSGYFDHDMDGNTYDRNKLDTYTAEQMKYFRGSNDWLSSDLWSWLNATSNPEYKGQSHSDRATDENGNGFDNQLGFLSNFKKDELAMITASTPAENVTQMVTLLSVDEIDALADNGFFNLHPPLTKSAIASDETSWYNTYVGSGLPDYIWATSTMCELNSYEVYAVESSEAHERYSTFYAAASGFGIRPVITVNISAVDGSAVSGEGTLYEPYILIG